MTLQCNVWGSYFVSGASPEEVRHDHVHLHSNNVSAFSNAICRGKYKSSASHKNILFLVFINIIKKHTISTTGKDEEPKRTPLFIL